MTRPGSKDSSLLTDIKILIDFVTVTNPALKSLKFADTESYLLQDLVPLMVMCGGAAVVPLTILFGERKLLVGCCLFNPIL